MKTIKLLNILSGATIVASPTLSISSIKENKVVDRVQWIEHSLNFNTKFIETDQNKEVVPNRVYETKGQMSDLLNNWLLYKELNEIENINTTNYSSKFISKSESGKKLNYDFMTKLLSSDDIVVNKMNFYVNDVKDKQYSVDMVGDFIIDKKEYKSMSILGYESTMKFTSEELLSGFQIAFSYYSYDILSFVHPEKWNAKATLNESPTVNVGTLNEYKNYFNSHPDQYSKVIAPYWLLKDGVTGEEYQVSAESLNGSEILTGENSGSFLSILLSEINAETNRYYLVINWHAKVGNNFVSGRYSNKKYDKEIFELKDCEISLNVMMNK
ncbi:hypothetical protein [Mesoplasma tabanidae]|uniref:Uncharacterized protein n=1 Tax=Mesoplasma tabanidae TaxID=219745 RepID=A0A2K8P4L3_9MOLU|nr:hypothetical protein [Mesoplasma tabanidae]ATZ21679.1 hypothetical protein MTABA_v1c04810 [Mesoplasma tabanidae]